MLDPPVRIITNRFILCLLGWGTWELGPREGEKVKIERRHVNKSLERSIAA